MKYSKWKIPYSSTDTPGCLLAEGYTPLLASMLALRGYNTVKAAQAFVDGRDELLLDPMRLKGMEDAVPRIRKAIEKREKIAVYGDYDVDGITSSCLLTRWLRSKGIDCSLYIPDRISEGYGLNKDAIKILAEKSVTLIISVDCGITASEEAAYARQIGVDLIITDHHECKDLTLPEAVAVIDPKQDGCPYANKDLAGVGVALKLVCAVEGKNAEMVNHYADLAAIGTVADVVPLVGENRYIVRTGLAALEKTNKPGIAALLRESGATDRRINSATIGFALAPRLNAAGRLGKTEIACKLLLTEDEREADELAAELCELNRNRQALEMDIWNDASTMVAGENPETPIVLSSENWHQGVIGIAASKLAEQYSLPTVMICLDGDKGKGSCRSYGGFNLFEALSACSEHLEGFGGHALAAGLNIRREKLSAFRAAFADYYLKNKPEELPELCCDIEITDPKILDIEGVESLGKMEPFGSGNPKPTMCILGARLERVIPIGGGKHLRITVSYRGQNFECVFFSHTENELNLRTGDTVDLAFTPQINEFRMKSSVQLQLIDIRAHDPKPLCAMLANTEERLPERSAAAYCPDRSAFVKVWRKLQAMGGSVAEDLDGLIKQCPGGVEPERFCICLLVLCEMGLIKMTRAGSVFGARLVNSSSKVNLEDSKLIKRLRARY